MRRENNFDLLRLILAWIVVATHCHDLSRAPSLERLAPLLQSRRAVEGFFAISGCLIVSSWERASSARDYFVRRAKRILPAYWLALLFCLVLGSFFTTLAPAAFWTNAGTYRYLFWNLLLLNFKSPGLPGVFTGNPSSAMDGALWTIKIEVAFYLFVPVLVWLMRRFGRVWILAGCFSASLLFRYVTEHVGRSSLAQQLPGQLAFFLVGTAVYYYYPLFVQHRRIVWIIAVASFVLALWSGSIEVDAIATPLLVMCIGLLAPPYRGVTTYGDFSYGAYVLHYPVVQAVVAIGLFSWNPWLAVALVSALVVVLSVSSWFGLERWFLRPARVRQQERDLPVTANVA